MAKKIKNEIIKFEDIINTVKHTDDTVSLDWNGFKLQIKKTLTIHDVVKCVRDVIQGCFADDGSYIPEVKDFYIRRCIITAYTNVVVPDGDVEKQCEVYYKTDLYDVVLNNADFAQLNQMLLSIDNKLNHLASANIYTANKATEKVMSEIEAINAKMGNLFGNVDPSAVQRLVSKLANADITPELIASAIEKARHDG